MPGCSTNAGNQEIKFHTEDICSGGGGGVAGGGVLGAGAGCSQGREGGIISRLQRSVTPATDTGQT